MDTFPMLLSRLREAQDILGDAVAMLTDDPRLYGRYFSMSRQLVRLIRELQQLESSKKEIANNAEQPESA